MKQKLEKLLGFGVEATENPDFGDYTSNVAMVKAKEEGKKPQQLANEIAKDLRQQNNLKSIIEKVEVAGPGFINFWLKNDVLVDNLMRIAAEKEKFGTSNSGKGRLTIVEYSSPNIAKPFGVGHLRSTVIGDAIANLMEATGWKVMRDNHLGDWGTQFGKMIYAIIHLGEGSKEKNIKKISSSENPVKELVKLYVEFHLLQENGDSILTESGEHLSLEDDEARMWFKKLEDGDKEAREIWQMCVDWSFVEFDRIYSILGVSFSKEFENGRGLGESFFESRMQAVLDELNSKKLLKVGEEGAKLVFFKDDKYPPAMIIKKDGATLYHTRDLATDKYRLEKYNPDLIINEVGSEQTLYFQQLFEIEKLLGWIKEGQRVHIGHGMYLMEGKKMSTRAGKTIELNEVLTEAIERAKKLGSDDDETAKKVGIGAIKYFDLLHQPSTNINFDWDRMFALEGNSGPYLQYTVARANSVLSKIENWKIDNSLEIGNWKLEIEELAVLRALIKFPEVVQNSAKAYSPNLLCNYLFDLAQKFNSFYNKYRILEPDNSTTKLVIQLTGDWKLEIGNFRLSLTAATGQVLKNGLKLLGIQAPERM